MNFDAFRNITPAAGAGEELLQRWWMGSGEGMCCVLLSLDDALFYHEQLNQMFCNVQVDANESVQRVHPDEASTQLRLTGDVDCSEFDPPLTSLSSKHKPGLRHDSPDLSPPRRSRHDSPDLSPPRRSRHDSPDLSPPRRSRHDSPDLSPPRRTRHDSPETSIQQHRNHPPKVAPSKDSPDRLLRKTKFSEVSSRQEVPEQHVPGLEDSSSAMTQQKAHLKRNMADGTAAGVVSGTQLKAELQRKREHDKER